MMNQHESCLWRAWVFTCHLEVLLLPALQFLNNCPHLDSDIMNLQTFDQEAFLKAQGLPIATKTV